jgi:hypothetical protein
MKNNPLAYEAYQELADAYAAKIDTKPHNAYYDRPALLSLLPDLEGKKVLDAGCTWRGFGKIVVMPSYRRSLEEIISPVIESGFQLEKVLEPKPTEEFKKADPVRFASLMHRPGFLCVRARKPD